MTGIGGTASGIHAASSPKGLSRHRHSLRVGLTAGIAIADVVALAGACLLGAALRRGDALAGNWEIFFFLAPTYLLAAAALNAYAIPTLTSPQRSLSASFTALIITTGLFLSATFALKVGVLLSRLEIGYVFVAAFLFVGTVRIGATLLIDRLLLPIVSARLVVLADGPAEGRPIRDVSTTRVNVREAGLVPTLDDPRFFAEISRLVGYADRVVLAFSDQDERHAWIEAMRLSGFEAEIVVDLARLKPLALSRWEDHTTLLVSRGPLTLGERLAKRLFDIALTCPLLLVAAPVIATSAVLVKLDTPGPAFFIQERVGRNNRTYRCFKIRTMRREATDAAGTVSASRGDRRVTPIGRFLRRTSIDELPQLVNVLIGNMSLVGPRPHALGSRAEGALFWEVIPDYWGRHSVKPGMTGLAQIRGLRGATDSRRDIESRVAADLEYINNWSLWLDMKILILTLRVAIHRNAH